MSLDRYLSLKQQLKDLEQSLETSSPNFVREVTQLQQWFQQQLLAQPPEAVDANAQSLYVEIHKQLRLLSTDAAFLQSARQPQTQQQRQHNLRDRLAILERYCNALLGEEDPS